MNAVWPSIKNIYAIGRNYVAHARELGNEVPSTPVVFNKSLSSLVTMDLLCFPSSLQPIHHEIEVVIMVSEEIPMGSRPTHDQISAVTLGIDFTARDLQSRLKAEGKPWHLAKNFKHACYLAQLCPFEDWGRPLKFRLFRNERLVQDGDTSLMIFPFLSLLETLCETQDLQPGDLIYTGTPAGVGPVAQDDVLRLECESLKINQQIRIGFST